MAVAFLFTYRRRLILQVTTYFQKELEYYCIRGIKNRWFASYLSNRKQFVPINGFKPNLADICCGVPLCSILSTLLFTLLKTEILTQILFSKTQKILKFNGKAALENCILIIKRLLRTLPKIFFDWVSLSSESHTYNTRWKDKN